MVRYPLFRDRDMDRRDDLADVRRAYARTLMSLAGISDSRIEDAYARVPREKFLGPGPWRLATDEGRYFETANADPAHLYADTVVSILPERGLNNGQPSFHVKLMAHASPQPGRARGSCRSRRWLLQRAAC